MAGTIGAYLPHTYRVHLPQIDTALITSTFGYYRSVLPWFCGNIRNRCGANGKRSPRPFPETRTFPPISFRHVVAGGCNPHLTSQVQAAKALRPAP